MRIAPWLVAACVCMAALAPAKVQPGGLLDDSIRKVLDQSSFRTGFTVKIEIPNSDDLEYRGTVISAKPDVLFVDATGSGQKKVQVVRKGGSVWVWKPNIEAWLTAEEAGDPAAGHGMQDTREVMEAILKRAPKAEGKGDEQIDDQACTRLEVPFAGKEIQDILREQAVEPELIDWEKSTATAGVWVRADGLIQRITCKAELTSTDPKAAGVLKYSARIDFESYNGAARYTFHGRDEKGKEVELTFSEPIKKALSGQ